MPPISRLLPLAIVLTALPSFAADGQSAPNLSPEKKIEFFETRIRPVLVKRCYECHSVESGESNGSLLVDSAAGLKRGGDSGPAIVPGKPDESPLIQAIRYDGTEMPPDGRLPKNIVRDLEQWVAMGAPDPRNDPAPDVTTKRTSIDLEAGRQFWSFRPLTSAGRPEVKHADWPLSDIDAFVLAELEAQELAIPEDAGRRSLIRRLYFDLIGLPPTPADVEAFVSDDSPNAVATVVDRLLDSPQFGVHWGRHWLDVARYADSNGSDFNATFHNAWRFRDYVINAFNSDKPFDQFVREQIAGDLLPWTSDEQRAEQLIASGFLLLGAKMLSERDKDKLRMDVVDEQLSAVGNAFLGMTFGCARCHDHKFDPIPTADYYALAGIFRSTKTLEGESQQYVSTWKRRDLPVSEERAAEWKSYTDTKKQLDDSIKTLKKQLDAAKKQLGGMKKNNLSNSVQIDDLAGNYVGNWIKSTSVNSFFGVGYVHDGNVEKGEKTAEFTVRIPKDGLYEVRLAYNAHASRAASIPVSIKHGSGEDEVRFDETRKPDVDGIFGRVGRFSFKADQDAVITISNRDTTGYVIVDGLWLVEVDDNGKPVIVDPKTDPAPEKADELKAAEAEIAKLDTAIKNAQKELEQLEEKKPEPLPQAFAADEMKDIGDCEIRIRGEHRNLGPIVKRGFLQVAMTSEAPVIPEDASGRVELADWLASPNNPLTARVLVNRIWSHLLGEGIVRSVDNFGKLGDRPTHPELLDRLAADFIGDGWSIKKTIRRIVLSRVYGISSDHNATAWQADPENKFLWRAHRRRLPAESIRDALLALSGRLDEQPGESPVRGLGTLVTQNTPGGEKYSVGESVLRSAYLPIIRSELPDILTVFDFADPDFVTGKRPATNVPAQALLLMNSPFVIDCAEATAARLQSGPDANSGDQLELVRRAYRTVLAREATDGEVARVIAFLTEASATDESSVRKSTRIPPLAQFIHALFASAEFRQLR
jgi:hypothetical protein